MSLDSFLVFDALIAAGVIAGSFLFLYTVGRYAMVPMLAALGIGAAFTALAPYVGHIPGISAWPTYQQNIAVFIVVTVLALYMFRQHPYFEPNAVPNGFERVVCSVLLSGFILAVVGSFLPADVVATLSPHIETLFVSDVSQTLWLIAPVIVFATMRGR